MYTTGGNSMFINIFILSSVELDVVERRKTINLVLYPIKKLRFYFLLGIGFRLQLKSGHVLILESPVEIKEPI